MSAAREITIGQRVIKIKELTVQQIRNWLNSEISKEDIRKEQENEGDEVPVDLIAEWLIEDMSFDTLTMMTDLKAEELNAMLPSHIALIVEGCQAVNPHFFSMQKRLMDLGKQLLNQEVPP